MFRASGAPPVIRGSRSDSRVAWGWGPRVRVRFAVILTLVDHGRRTSSGAGDEGKRWTRCHEGSVLLPAGEGEVP